MLVYGEIGFSNAAVLIHSLNVWGTPEMRRLVP